MKFLTQRALFYSFATQEIEGGGAVEVWRAVAGLFGVSPEEERSVEKLLSGAALSGLKTAEDVRLLQKCADGFGEAFRLSADEQETAELKYQALFKIGTLAGEYRAAPLKAVTLAYRRDPVAAVLYALQILMHNRERSALGCEILAQALSSEQSGDAGLVLLCAGSADREEVYGKLSETPDMILHPETLKELAQCYGLNPAPADRSTRIGF